MINRRQFLAYSTLGLASVGFLRATPVWATQQQEIRLIASRGQHRFIADQAHATSVMYYNESIPGPTLRIPQGQAARISFNNQLQQASSIHWHGLRIDNTMDGVPGMTQKLVEPGETFNYQFTSPDAGTYWYHTHQRAWEQLAFGLAGVLIVEERNPPLVDQDLVFAVDDWRLNDNLQIDEDSLGALHDWAHGGRMGNFVSVNGLANKSYPVAQGERLRLRVVNIANSRTMTLGFNLPEISVIAIDGQPVTPFKLEQGQLTLAPGQRADLIIDVTLDPEQVSPIQLLVRDKAIAIANFKVAKKIKRDKLLDTPVALAENPANRIQLPNKLTRIPLRIEGGAMGNMQSATYQGKPMNINELIQHKQIWAFNGIAGLAEEPLFRVARGNAINLDIENDNSWPHAIHLHGHHFIDSREPHYRRDTALFTRGQQGQLKFVADNPGKWLIHCHMIEHQAGGMLTWFEVT